MAKRSAATPTLKHKSPNLLPNVFGNRLGLSLAGLGRLRVSRTKWAFFEATLGVSASAKLWCNHVLMSAYPTTMPRHTIVKINPCRRDNNKIRDRCQEKYYD